MKPVPPASPGLTLAEVDTPALIIDLDAFERNLRRLADAVAGSGVRVRAHAKTHKCAEIARRQVAAGAIGVCCQKVAEAEAMVEGGIADVLISNEIVGAKKLARLAALARHARIGVCVDDARNLLDLREAAARAGVTLDVYVEIDVGARRCGVAPGEAALALAREAARGANLRFAGLQAYHGPAQHLRGNDERRAEIERAAAAVRQTRSLIEASGIACETVTGAGSGSFMFEVGSGAWDEIQPGSYIFMDADYARNEWSAPLPRFEHALFVLAGVMSRPGPDRAVLDAGLKASSVDAGLPTLWQRPGIACVRLSDEHAVLEISRGAAPPALGEKILLVPGHCDPTVNLHDYYVCMRGGLVEALWPIEARGAIS
ncbi:MAG: DSD1 family PLP-dependent enzyme [Betaproteobacteria bacterium]|nr:DSD1 family PLP-dependent enzyme [Betaproteobacteria bacterium]